MRICEFLHLLENKCPRFYFFIYLFFFFFVSFANKMKQISAVLTTSKKCNSLKEIKFQIFQIEAHFGHAQGNLFLAKYLNRTKLNLQEIKFSSLRTAQFSTVIYRSIKVAVLGIVKFWERIALAIFRGRGIIQFQTRAANINVVCSTVRVEPRTYS